MLNQVANVFSDMKPMLKKMKKPYYIKNMETFRKANGHIFSEMTEKTERAEDKETAAAQIALAFVDAVEEKFAKNGRMRAGVQIDLNFFMIYYFFPALLLTESECAAMLADAICKEWGSRFKESNISYSDYEKICSSFNTKIFGII